MKPIINEFTVNKLSPPSNLSDNIKCGDLPVCIKDGCYYSYWSLSSKEKLKVLFGTPVRLAVKSNEHPMVMLSLDH